MAKKTKCPKRPAPSAPNAVPPPINPFDPNDPKGRALFQIRVRRWLFLALAFAFLPICTLLARFSLDLTAFAAFGLFVLGHVLYRWMNQSKCPNCGNWFFVKQTGEGKMTGSGLSFPPINRCQSCGQSLHG